MVGMRFSMAMFCARMTFFVVMGKKAPAFTVASFTMSMTMREWMRARPVMTPAAGAPPHSSYILCAAWTPSSKKEPGSARRLMRSRAVSRDFACWLSMALAPPPSRIFSSSLRTWATSSASARMLDSKRRELGSTFVWRTLSIERAVDSVRSRMRAKLETTCETTYYTSVRRTERGDLAGKLSCGVRCGDWIKDVAQVGTASQLADRFGDHGGVARGLYGHRGGRGSISASGCAFDSQQCAHREPACTGWLALCVAWDLAAFRYALVFADCRAWI